MQAEPVIEMQHVGLRHGQRWARRIVGAIGIGDDRVQTIVAARHLHHDQRAPLRRLRPGAALVRRVPTARTAREKIDGIIMPALTAAGRRGSWLSG